MSSFPSFTFVSMVTSGVHTNASQFYISLSPSKHLNGRSVVFGRVIEGDDSLKAMEKVSCLVRVRTMYAGLMVLVDPRS